MPIRIDRIVEVVLEYFVSSRVAKMKLENSNLDSDNGAVSNQFQLHESIRSKNLENLVQLLGNAGDTIDINQPDWDESGNAPIIDATLQGQVDMVR